MGARLNRRILFSTVVLSTAVATVAWANEPNASAAVAEVVVTASPIAGDPDRFATIVDQVDRDEVLAAGGANLADALRDTPGVSGTGFASGASRPVIRGMDAQRVKIVENGQSSSDVSDVGPDHGVPIDPLAAQDVEIVRGAATLRYGSQAIGGVVNAINNRVPMRPVAGVDGEVSAAYNSVSSAGEGSILLDAGAGPFAVHFDAFGRRASDYDTPLGRQDNSFFRGGGYSGGASYFFGAESDSRVGLSATHYQTTYGIPGDDTFIRMRQDKGVFGTALDLDFGALQTFNLDVSYADYSHSEIDPAGSVVLSTFNNKEWDARAEAVFGQVGPLSAVAMGIQLQQRDFAGLGEAADYLLPTETRSEAGFIFVEAPIGALQFQAAVRVERVSISGTPASGVPTDLTFTPVSVSAGFTFDLTGAVRLGFTATSAARAPAQTELFALGPHDGPKTFETGDPALTLERANSLEATVRYRFGSRGRIDASLWVSRFDGYIYGALTGRTCDETGACELAGPEPLKELNYSQRDAAFWGYELKGALPLASAWGGDLSLTVLADYVRATFSAGGGDVPRIQPGRIGGGLSWTSDRFDASFLALAVSPQNRVGLGDTPTPGYTSVDAQIAWRPFGGSRRLQVLLVGHNLADQTVRNATALNKNDVVMPGRDLRLVVMSRF